MRKTFWIVLSAILAFSMTTIAPSAKGFGSRDAQSKIMFSQPVEVPGHVALPAGTYWFVARSSFGVSPDEVLIYNADRTKLETQVQTIPARRMEPTGREVLTFAEQPGGRPVVLVSWFGPGSVTGYRFVYPMSTEKQLEGDDHVTLNLRVGQPARVG
jgi:hypothetical protein